MLCLPYLLVEENEATIIDFAKASSIGARAKFGPSQQLQWKSEDWLITLFRVRVSSSSFGALNIALPGLILHEMPIDLPI